MKENRIPIGKKRENLNKLAELSKNDESGLFDNQVLPKKVLSKTNKKSKMNESKLLKVIDVNNTLSGTSLIKPIEKPRPKLSTIKELEEKAMYTNIKAKLDREAKLNSAKTEPINITPKLVDNNEISEEKSTKLVRDLLEANSDDFNNTVNEMKPKTQIPEIVLSPFVCTTRGQKWKPSPRKPPKLSELFNKYEENNIADVYREKLDKKTVELQNKVKYWTELSSENGNNIPQAIKDEIDVVNGQTKLLTTDKFIQMRSLVEEFDNKSGSMPITTGDLDGFWDMLLLQVEKLERLFSELAILKDNNWVPIQPVAKKIINKVTKVNKHIKVKSRIADFLKNKKLKEKNSGQKHDDPNHHFNEMKLSNNTCLISSTPTSSNQKNSSLTPMLLKTMELSYVARRSGMTPMVVVEPHISPLKPALRNPVQEKGIKRKNIHFENPKTVTYGFITPENSPKVDLNQKKNVQKRIATPHTIKTTKINHNDNPIESRISIVHAEKSTDNNTKIKDSAKTKISKEKIIIKKSAKNNVSDESQNHCISSENIKQDVLLRKNATTTNFKEKAAIIEKSADAKINNSCSIRRSSRLAKKPSKNYKC